MAGCRIDAVEVWNTIIVPATVGGRARRYAAPSPAEPSPQSSMQRHPWWHCRRAAWALRPWAWPPSDDGPTADGAGCWLLHDMPCNSC